MHNNTQRSKKELKEKIAKINQIILLQNKRKTNIPYKKHIDVKIRKKNKSKLRNKNTK